MIERIVCHLEMAFALVSIVCSVVLIADIAPTRTEAGGQAKNGQPLRLITREQMELVVSTKKPIGPDAKWIREGRNPASAREEAVRLQTVFAQKAMASRDNSVWTLVAPDLSPKQIDALSKVIAEVESRSDHNVEVVVETLAIYQVHSKVLRELFPEETFVVVPSHTRKRPGSDEAVAIPLMNVSTFVFGGPDGDVREFWQSGKYTQFGNYLRDRKVMLHGQEDATKVWDAFCAIHNAQWPAGQHRHIGKNKWWLNWHSPVWQGLGTFDYYYELLTDEQGHVLQGKLESKRRHTEERHESL